VVPAPAILSAGATSPAAVPAASGRTDRDSTSDPVPGVRPPSPRQAVHVRRSRPLIFRPIIGQPELLSFAK